MKEAQVLHLLQLQSIELLHVGNKQTQLRDKFVFEQVNCAVMDIDLCNILQIGKFCLLLIEMLFVMKSFDFH